VGPRTGLDALSRETSVPALGVELMPHEISFCTAVSIILPENKHVEYIKNYNINLLLFSTYALQPSKLIVRSGLDVPTFAARRLHACHHARAPSGGRWNCGREMSENFA